MIKVTVNEDRCKGCGLCTIPCPKKIMRNSPTRLNKKGFPPAECIDQDACISCAMCATICPDVAITIEK